MVRFRIKSDIIFRVKTSPTISFHTQLDHLINKLPYSYLEKPKRNKKFKLKV